MQLLVSGASEENRMKLSPRSRSSSVFCVSAQADDFGGRRGMADPEPLSRSDRQRSGTI